MGLLAAASVGLLFIAQGTRDVAGEEPESDEFDYEKDRYALGTPCPSEMPGGAPFPYTDGCFDHGSRSGPKVEMVFWSTHPKDAEYYNPEGVVIEDARHPRELLAVDLEAEAECGVELEDVSKDGVPDVIISCPTYLGEWTPGRTDVEPGERYTFVIRDKKGMYKGPTLRLVSPTWGDGKFDDLSYDEVSSSKLSRWRWKGRSLGLVEEPFGTKLVEGLKATATSFSAKAYAPAMAVDGRHETTWAAKGDGAGQTLTVTLPRMTNVVRVLFTTGFAHHSEKLGDLFTLNDQIQRARLRVGTEPEVATGTDDGRYVSWVPAHPVKAKSLTITVVAVKPGSKWRDTCISEVEVWE
jgi:hypothetical protein